MKKMLEIEGLILVQAVGQYMALFFDWEKLDPINPEEIYYLVEIVPESQFLPIEYIRPNSEGPLHFRLKENVNYRINLLKVPFFKYKVHSDILDNARIDLVFEHEALQKMIWGNIDWKMVMTESSSPILEILTDGKLLVRRRFDETPMFELFNRPNEVEVRLEGGKTLFLVNTNFSEVEVSRSLEFYLRPPPTTLHCFTSTKQVNEWRVRAEINEHFQMRKVWPKGYAEKFSVEDPSRLIGVLSFYENERPLTEIRLWGFSCKVDYNAFNNGIKKKYPQKGDNETGKLKLRLEITTAHRELYKQILIEKEVQIQNGLVPCIGFSEEEILLAEKRLFELSPFASWDSSFLELVVLFETEHLGWEEFQREVAHSLKWECLPGETTESCMVEWSIYDLYQPEKRVCLLRSGKLKRDHWPAKVVLKPFSADKLLCWWDLEKEKVKAAVWEKWQVGLDETRFYLKVHEEYAGDRKHSPHLEQHIIDIFSRHQNTYLSVEPNRCYSVEIVARHFQEEIALTPISDNIVTPRTIKEIETGPAPHKKLKNHWFHTSQRKVGHLKGDSGENRAKVMIHLHIHCPNLYRIDPFRESFLRNSTWPVKTNDGMEVHNPPGEWVLRNCMDSWLPILRLLLTLAEEGVDYQISLDISPPAAYMISHPRFKDYMSRYLIRTKEYIKSHIHQMKAALDSPEYIWAARRYYEDVDAIEQFYHNVIHKNIVGAFRKLELQGYIEISTCTVTHGMVSQLETMPDSLKSQIGLAGRTHKRIFGDRPKGIWLAENAYFPGIETYLAKENMNFFFVEAESILWGSSCPLEEEYNPVSIPGSEVVAFGRSRLGRVQVWDAKVGYAGHSDFREYHIRHWGLPIKKITSKTSDDKKPYNPDIAEKVAYESAQDFYQKLCEKANELGKKYHPTIPLISCSYDAELFGHHWYEGTQFLMELLREFHRCGDTIGLVTPSHYLASNPLLPDLIPNPSTWGHETTNIKWTSPKVAWTQRELERADNLLRNYLDNCLKGSFNDFQKRAVAHMGAELLRAQSSDLTFVIMAGDFEEDMQREIQKYLDYFNRLRYLINNDIQDEEFLAFRQYENDMFPEIREFLGID